MIFTAVQYAKIYLEHVLRPHPKKIGDSGYIHLKLISFCIACVTGIVFHDLYARFHVEMKGGFEERISL